MITLKVTEASAQKSLQTVMSDLKEANAAAAAANKKAEACKEYVTRWLKENRNISLENLKIGDIVHVEGICMIEISKQNKFDQNEFMLAQPGLFEEYKRDFAVRKWKALVG